MLGCNLLRETQTKKRKKQNYSRSDHCRGFEIGLVIGRWRPSIIIQTRDLSKPFKLILWLLLLPLVWLFGLFGKSRQLLVAIDFGTSGIKLVQLAEVAGKLVLKKTDFEELAPEVIVDGAIMNMDALGEALVRLVERSGIKGRKVAFGVSGHSVISKIISLPQMSAGELADSISWEAEQYIPFDIREVYIDSEVIDPNAGSGQMDVLLTAAKKDLVNDYIQCLVDAGLRPRLANVESYAVLNMVDSLYGLPSDKTVAVVDIGACMINIAIATRGKLVFIRDISMGSGFLTEDIQRQFAVSYSEAEQLQSNPTGIDSNITARKVEELTMNAAKMLVTEIQRSIEFFKAVSAGEEIDSIYLFGGGSNMLGIRPALEERFPESKLLTGDCFAKLRNADGTITGIEMPYGRMPRFAVAVGLALQKG